VVGCRGRAKGSGVGGGYTGQRLESKKTDGGIAEEDLHGESTLKDSKRDSRLQRTSKRPAGAEYSVFGWVAQPSTGAGFRVGT